MKTELLQGVAIAFFSVGNCIGSNRRIKVCPEEVGSTSLLRLCLFQMLGLPNLCFFSCCTTALDGSEIPFFFQQWNQHNGRPSSRGMSNATDNAEDTAKLGLACWVRRTWYGFSKIRCPKIALFIIIKKRKTWQFEERQQNRPLNSVPWTVPRISIRFKAGEVLDEKMAQVWATESDCLSWKKSPNFRPSFAWRFGHGSVAFRCSATAGDPAEAASIWRVTTDQQEEVQELPMENFLLPIAAVHMNRPCWIKRRLLICWCRPHPCQDFCKTSLCPHK